MNGIQPRKRKQALQGTTHRMQTGCGNLYVTVNSDEEGLFEIFAHLGKAGNCGSAQLEAICRSVTIGLRAGVDPEAFIKQLSGIKCPSPSWDEGEQVLSCADAISKVLKKEVKEIGKEVDN